MNLDFLKHVVASLKSDVDKLAALDYSNQPPGDQMQIMGEFGALIDDIRGQLNETNKTYREVRAEVFSELKDSRTHLTLGNFDNSNAENSSDKGCSS